MLDLSSRLSKTALPGSQLRNSLDLAQLMTGRSQ
jgi:hypothetical protein